MVKKITVILAVFGLVALMAFIIFQDKQDTVFFDDFVQENNIVIYDLNLIRVLDPNGGFMILNSDKAHFDKSVMVINLDNMDLEFKQKETHLFARADNGKYEVEKNIIADGNINGFLNGMNFITDNDSKLFYDLQKKHGIVRDNITLYQNNDYIKARELNYYGNNDTTVFNDNVNVLYSGELRR